MKEHETQSTQNETDKQRKKWIGRLKRMTKQKVPTYPYCTFCGTNGEDTETKEDLG
jgi:hypothetical protein